MPLFSRINLSKTDYNMIQNARVIHKPNYDILKIIYEKYCDYKKFVDPIPFSIDDHVGDNIDIIGYYDNRELVAYSLILKYLDKNSVFSDQFAWNYYNPKLRLGIKSLEHECAFYKNLGYEYLYLGEHCNYKSKFQGYEILDEDLFLQETT